MGKEQEIGDKFLCGSVHYIVLPARAGAVVQ